MIYHFCNHVILQVDTVEGEPGVENDVHLYGTDIKIIFNKTVDDSPVEVGKITVTACGAVSKWNKHINYNEIY